MHLWRIAYTYGTWGVEYDKNIAAKTVEDAINALRTWARNKESIKEDQIEIHEVKHLEVIDHVAVALAGPQP